ncbi:MULTISPECIES: hypothetical protein [unclassified Staphylococcus]|uniref:hypothetical protein n=1 Tax=unclassified Staphylococcus TaxID=91994 RepID=UPI001010777B|nr:MULTISPECIES: hypothetical protein [unclassified Staphylococcus]MBL0377877.1 hypothetical protein [Staphylococcus sp. S75]MBL0383828.1 hypothetical protein [Staphylococcus sp. S59]MBL0401874.1 hypothetical protein [Staphylococcus sp. S36]RXZ28107.1 hypothetical protein ESM34_07070 [Staphylococcus sp. SNAZ 59]RXZ32972.1 hypothetical protein ESM33_10765 [Staphylococcus sp. SNAZ 36]
MEFAYYEAKALNDFENKLKALALNKKYTFSKSIEVLKEDEILEKSSSYERELLKVFKNNSQITTYHFKSHKSNYLIIVGETKTPNVIGLTVIFDKKPFKQMGKAALGTLIGLTAMSGGSILLAAAGLGIIGSYFKRTFTIKGPLGKEITRIIENHFGEPVEIKA